MLTNNDKEIENFLSSRSHDYGEYEVARKKRKTRHKDNINEVVFENKKLGSLLVNIGVVLLAVASVIFFLTFYPIIKEEVLYLVYGGNDEVVIVTEEKAEGESSSKANIIVPESEDFGVIIPKIRANAKVLANVDPYNEKEYQYKLSQGVAHAKGTVFPTQTGNVFLFAHSAGNFYEANRYNAVFYLLNKLEKGDEIIVFFEKNKYKYKVTKTTVVNEDQVEYLQTREAKQTITLMTCWPAGTTLQRLLVIGERVEE